MADAGAAMFYFVNVSDRFYSKSDDLIRGETLVSLITREYSDEYNIPYVDMSPIYIKKISNKSSTLTEGGMAIGINYQKTTYGDFPSGMNPGIPAGIGSFRGGVGVFFTHGLSVREWRTNEGTHTGYPYNNEPIFFFSAGIIGSQELNSVEPGMIAVLYWNCNINNIKYLPGVYYISAPAKRYSFNEEITNDLIKVQNMDCRNYIDINDCQSIQSIATVITGFNNTSANITNVSISKTGIGQIGNYASTNLKTLLGNPNIGNYVDCYVYPKTFIGGSGFLAEVYALCVADSQTEIKRKYIWINKFTQSQSEWESINFIP